MSKLSKIAIVHDSKSLEISITHFCRIPDAGPTPSGTNIGRTSPQGVCIESLLDVCSDIGIW